MTPLPIFLSTIIPGAASILILKSRSTLCETPTRKKKTLPDTQLACHRFKLLGAETSVKLRRRQLNRNIFWSFEPDVYQKVVLQCNQSPVQQSSALAANQDRNRDCDESICRPRGSRGSDDTPRRAKESAGALKARLTKFVSMVDELNQENPNFDQLQVRFEKFKNLESEFDNVQKQIEFEVDEGDALDEQINYREEFENNFSAAVARVNTILNAAKSETPNANTRHSNQSVTNPNFVPVALPTMSLPSFDGSWEQWLSFYQRFDSLIHSNASLSPIQKFQYLNSCVTGEASSVIKSLGITTENYPIAIALLKESTDHNSFSAGGIDKCKSPPNSK
ncbi:hypothetical protein GEV33_006007 [Tenebrio molitor]|uniref:Uncharacterized protein n=1 Tax=Tenebrio molitor TaxID=7067 RepID=A0A8J6HLD4_TENMO|nr:hypothetical protein GEV33_006007 [Tenebrio molitor]